MELVKIRRFKRSEFGSKANVKEVEVGKWFKFPAKSVEGNLDAFGKVVRIIDDEYVEVEKYFEMPSYRPCAGTKWYDSLPLAI